MKVIPDVRKQGRRKLIWAGIALVAVVFFGTLPFFYDVHSGQWGYVLFMVFIYATVSQAWNLIGGYTGQISLGQNAFFGLGAFTMALLWVYDVTKTGYWFDPVLMILGGVTPVILAILVGLPLLSRLRGDYFSFGTLGVGMILSVLFLNGGGFTGGGEGKLLIKYVPDDLVINLRTHYWAAFAVAVLATAIVYFMTTSRLGLALKAIREDEVSAASHGVNVLKYKIIAFAVSAALTGVAGTIYTYYLLHPMPMNVFSQNWLFLPIMMTVLGGTGTIIGPWIGAFVLYLIAYYSDTIPGFEGWYPVVLGVIIILVMLFLPRGIVGIGEKIPLVGPGGFFGRRSK
jgi:branched-chain amino acid transport system permease protein